MSFYKIYSHQPRAWIFAQMVTAILLIGLLDLFTGYQISFVLFYGVPIFVVAWFCERKLAWLAALLACILWSLVAQRTGHPYMRGWNEAWEVGVHLGFFLFTASVGSALRANHDTAAARIALLEHSQRLEREIINVSDAERRRIGQDLHDGLCQVLAALSCSATSLRDDLEKLNLPTEADVAGELAALLRDAVAQTRDLARGLLPVRLDQVGLVLALEALAKSVTQLQGVQCTFESHPATQKHEGGAALNFYRIAQEAINNATRHGRPHNIAISLNTKGHVTTLRVADDGTGIRENGINESGMGLSIMRYRARLNGGDLEIGQREGGGTVVLCTARADHKANEVPAL